MTKSILRKYAKLIVQMGVNIKKGQGAVILADTAQSEIALMVAEEAYRAGAKWVDIRWTNQDLDKMRYKKESVKVLSATQEWEKARMQYELDELPVRIWIDSDDPDGLKGVNVEKMQKANLARMKVRKPYRDAMENKYQWTIVAVPSAKWAKKVFPDLAESEAMDKLWEAIFQAVRITGDGRCVDKWHRHIETLAHRVEKLNQLNFKSLHYTNSLGTDLTVELPEDHIWEAGNDVTLSGRTYIANIPTEEVFTSPLKTGVNGVVYSALPLSHNGTIIDKFHFVVKDGKIVEVHAEQGEEALKAAVTVDEGASYFGEVALVPYDSPISNQKILFYNTLFDENAACHIAFGEAYPCLKDGQAMSKDELKARGLNDSITHVDFMVGTPDLNILGITHDGKEIPVFVDGNFAPEI